MFNESVRPSVRPSVCRSETKIWSTFRCVLLGFKGVRGADVQQKNKFGPTFYVLYNSSTVVRCAIQLRQQTPFSVCLFVVCLSVCLKPKFNQLFDLSCLNLRGSAERLARRSTSSIISMRQCNITEKSSKDTIGDGHLTGFNVIRTSTYSICHWGQHRIIRSCILCWPQWQRE